MVEPNTWGRLRGLLKRAAGKPGLCIYVQAYKTPAGAEGHTADLWWDERNGDEPYVEPGGAVSVDVSSLIDDVPDPDPVRVMLAGCVRFTVPGNYGDVEVGGAREWATFEEAVAAARSTIKRFDYPGQDPDHVYSAAAVALRSEWRWAPQDGPGLGADSELLRWTVTRSRVILHPAGHGLSHEQVAAGEALDNAGARGWA